MYLFFFLFKQKTAYEMRISDWSSDVCSSDLLRTDLHVADGMIAKGLGVALPHRHGVGHELAHGRLEVVVAHDAAGDAAGPGGDAALVDDEDVLAAALAARRQRLGQVQRGREAVDAGADDDNAAAVGKRHGERKSNSL